MKRNLLCLLFAFTFFGSAALLSACTPPVDNTEPDGNGHMHSLVHHVPLAATCETEGNIEYWSCAGCGKYFSDENAVTEIETAVIPATGHSWSEWETVYPVSCTYDGSESRTCSVCYAYETRTVAATGHDYSGGWKFDEQTHWQECKNCGEKKDAAAHSFNGDKCAVCDYTITYTENLDYELSGDGSYYTVSGRGGADDSFIFIPAQFGGKPVKSIGESAFENDDKLTGIYLPETVESIADYAFYGCQNLTSVKMQDGLETIGVQAFRNCEELQDIEISGKLNAVGQSAFENCYALTNVYIRDIAAWCAIQFGGGQSNPLFYAHKFYLNGKTVTELTIPDAVTAIADYAFYSCNNLNLTFVQTGKNLKTIGKYAFYGCSLTDIILSNNVTSIGEYAFYGCDFVNITIPDGVTTIGEYTFSSCSSLRSITIPDGVTTIGNSAFFGCSSLTSITIPDNVTTIREHTFQDCSSLTGITIPDGVTTIGDSAFQGCSLLRSITIPDGVTTIGSSAFYGCTSLRSITIPDSVTTIGSSAFQGCTSLRSITIPGSVTEINSYAFQNCSSLTSITIPDSVTTIGISAFQDCSSLRSITIPASVTTIRYSAFQDCTSLTEAYFTDPDGWRDDGTGGEIPAEQLSDPQTAAEWLKSEISLYKN